jgi:hypothetical protein
MPHEDIELNFDASCQQILGLESEIFEKSTKSTKTEKHFFLKIFIFFGAQLVDHCNISVLIAAAAATASATVTGSESSASIEVTGNGGIISPENLLTTHVSEERADSVDSSVSESLNNSIEPRKRRSRRDQAALAAKSSRGGGKGSYTAANLRRHAAESQTSKIELLENRSQSTSALLRKNGSNKKEHHKTGTFSLTAYPTRHLIFC